MIINNEVGINKIASILLLKVNKYAIKKPKLSEGDLLNTQSGFCSFLYPSQILMTYLSARRKP